MFELYIEGEEIKEDPYLNVFGFEKYINFEGHSYILREDGLYESIEYFEVRYLKWIYKLNKFGYFSAGPRKDSLSGFPKLIGRGSNSEDLAVKIVDSNEGWFIS